MSLEFELRRHKPPSISSATSTYSRDALISLGSATPNLTPPAPASAKVNTMNHILRKDSLDFLNAQPSPHRSIATPPLSGQPDPHLHTHTHTNAHTHGHRQGGAGTMGPNRSQTLPMPVLAAPLTGGKKAQALATSAFTLGLGPDEVEVEVEAEEHLDDLVIDRYAGVAGVEDEGRRRKAKTPITAPMPMLLHFADSPIDADADADIDIELHSARHPHTGIPAPAPASKRPGLSRHASASAAASASSVFNTPPGQRITASPLSAEMAWSLSKQHVGLRQTAHNEAYQRSRSSSTSSDVTITASPDDLEWRRPSMTAGLAGAASPVHQQQQQQLKSASGLNAFAPPWPLPDSTPRVMSSQPRTISRSSTTSSTATGTAMAGVGGQALPAARAESGTLPALPSLPAKPQGSLPPVFVKREAALLPQGMALPHVAPMGREWEGDNSLSGNDKRRRASEQGSVISRNMSNLSLRSNTSSPVHSGGSMPTSRRPDKLVRLGERLKENVNRPII